MRRYHRRPIGRQHHRQPRLGAAFPEPQLKLITKCPNPLGLPKRGRSKGWLLLRSEGFCVRASRSVTRWLGAAPGQLLGRNWALFLHAEDKVIVRKLIDIIQRGEVPPRSRQRWTARSGAIVTMDVQCFVHRSPTQGVMIRKRLTRISSLKESTTCAA